MYIMMMTVNILVRLIYTRRSGADDIELNHATNLDSGASVAEEITV